jgi:hypothetical protein
MSETPPPERPEFVLPAPKRMTPWVKALVVLTVAGFLMYFGFIGLILLLEQFSIYETAAIGL